MASLLFRFGSQFFDLLFLCFVSQIRGCQNANSNYLGNSETFQSINPFYQLEFTHVKTTTKLSALAVALVAFAAAGSAVAQDSANMNITLNIDPGCQLTVSDFVETYDGTVDESTENLSVAVMCNRDTAYELSVDQGQNFGAKEPDMRALSSGSEYISYELFQDASMTTPWGTGSEAITDVGNGNAQWFSPMANFLIHAAPNGTYTDDLTVTVNWADL